MNNVIIIAEAGVNHNGSIDLAKKLIDAAVNAGVDFVKFQTFKSESLVSKSAKKASYQIENTNDGSESQLQMLKKLELSKEQHYEIVSYCKEKKISFFSTAFDIESLEFLKELGLTMVKIPSGEITNLPYLRKAAELFSEVIISTGMSTMNDIEQAINVFLKAGHHKNTISILHCNTEYPNHTLGSEVPIAAVALGAQIIEKHFTLDRSLPGPDQLASLEPNELKYMVDSIRNIELAISGSGEKLPSDSERKNIEIARKSIVAKINILKGEEFSEKNITTKRPGNGLSPMQWDNVIGKIANKNFNEDDLIDIN
jgi:sialic acid synthase SpsE